MKKKHRCRKIRGAVPVQSVFVTAYENQCLLAIVRRVELAMYSDDFHKESEVGVKKLIRRLEEASKRSSSGHLSLTEEDVDFLSSNLELAASHLLRQPGISKMEKKAIRDEIGPLYHRLLVAKCAFEVLYPNKPREAIPVEERETLFWHLRV